MINYTETQLNELAAIQTRLEERGRDLGAERYDRRTEAAAGATRETGTSYGSILVSKNIQKVADAFNEIVNPEVKGRGRTPACFALIKDVNPRVVSMVTLSAVIGGVTKNQTVTKVASLIADGLFHEVRRAALDDEQLKHFGNMLKKTGAQGKDAARLLDVAEGDADFEPWDKVKALTLGRAMLQVVIDSAGLVEVMEGEKVEGSAETTPATVKATAELQDWITRHREDFRLLSPVYLPMVVPPRKWTRSSIYNGCYLTNAMAPVPFVKRKGKLQMQRLRELNPVAVFDAVNAVQETPWRIRKPVLTLLKRMQAERNNLGLPLSSMPPQTDKPVDESAPYHAQKAQKQLNRETANLRALVGLNIATAEEFAEFEAFYVPHHLDTRGRVYPLPALNPQGADYVKGLLEFAEGKRIGTDGIFWLKVHTANLFGVDKVPFEDRVKWVNDNWTQLIASGLDPFGCTFWTGADKPIQAFAACVELLGVSMEGADYISRIAVALDGSCSGLQHLGAAFRCEITAKAVNLIPNERPNDIYQDVADKVTAWLKAETEEGNRKLADQWLAFCDGRIGRKITKRSVMTFPYGSKAAGFTQQLIDDILKPAMTSHAEHFPFENPRVAAQYLAHLIERAVSATVLKAAEAMQFLQGMAGCIAAGGKVIEWVTPLGFPVVQDYRMTKSRQIDSVLFGKRFQERISQETDAIDARKMVNAISPNVVHSLDSTHLLMAALQGKAEGLDAFAFIHDSFGTHAADTGRFFEIIRETFVDLYEQPVFESLAQQFTEQTDPDVMKSKRKTLPDLPSVGLYDLTLVCLSHFAFA